MDRVQFFPDDEQSFIVAQTIDLTNHPLCRDWPGASTTGDDLQCDDVFIAARAVFSKRYSHKGMPAQSLRIPVHGYAVFRFCAIPGFAGFYKEVVDIEFDALYTMVAIRCQDIQIKFGAFNNTLVRRWRKYLDDWQIRRGKGRGRRLVEVATAQPVSCKAAG